MKQLLLMTFKKSIRDFLGSPAIETPCFHYRVLGFLIDSGKAKIPSASRPEKKKKKSFKDDIAQNLWGSFLPIFNSAHKIYLFV